MKESDVRDRIYARLKDLQRRHPLFYTAIVGSARQRRGLPDIRIVFYGFSIDLELKRDADHEATAAQKKAIRDLRNACGTAAVIYSVEQLDHLLTRVLRLARQLVYCPNCHAANVNGLTDMIVQCHACGKFDSEAEPFHHARIEL